MSLEKLYINICICLEGVFTIPFQHKVKLMYKRFSDEKIIYRENVFFDCIYKLLSCLAFICQKLVCYKNYFLIKSISKMRNLSLEID